MATIYLIRHGEKPPKDPEGDDVNGLSIQGIKRADGLPQVFGKSSGKNIGYIIAQQYKEDLDDNTVLDGSRKRPYDTVFPLSLDLGLTIDTSVDRDDPKGVANAVAAWSGEGNILVCWEHGVLGDIVKKIGVAGKVSYPDDRFDLIWTLRPPYENFHSWSSEGIEGLDDGNKGL